MLLEFVLGILSSLRGSQAYQGTFLLLVLAGVGIPLSQDMVLLAAAGYTLIGAMTPGPLFAVAVAGILAGDILTFWTGHDGASRLLRQPWAARVAPPDRLVVWQANARRYALPFSFVTRFLIGQRATLYFIGGTLRMPWRPFLIGNGVATLLYVGAMIYGVRALGWTWSRMDTPFDRVDDVLTAAFWLAVFVGLWRRRGSRA